MILNNVRQHKCFIIQGSYIGYIFGLIDQSLILLIYTHWDPNVYTAPCDLTCEIGLKMTDQ